MVEKVAEGEMNIKDISHWLKRNTISYNKESN